MWRGLSGAGLACALAALLLAPAAVAKVARVTEEDTARPSDGAAASDGAGADPDVARRIEAAERAADRAKTAKLHGPRRHPISDTLHAEDLTLQLTPLDPHKLNDVAHVGQHHTAVVRMAKRGGLDGRAVTELQKELREHMREYQQAKAKRAAYEDRLAKLPADRRASLEHQFAETARSLHHKFYRLKMRVILSSKTDAPFAALREMMKSDKFTDEDRANFEAEIKAHVQARENFAAAQAKRSAALNHPQNTIPETARQEKKAVLRGTVVKHQKKMSRDFDRIHAMIARQAGEL